MYEYELRPHPQLRTHQIVAISLIILMVLAFSFAMTWGCIHNIRLELDEMKEQIDHEPAKNQPAGGQIAPEEVMIPTDRDKVYPPKEE